MTARGCTIAGIASALLLMLMGCAARQRGAPPATNEVLFSGALQEIAPHHDGDTFVFRMTGAGVLDGVYVERVSAPETEADFVSTMTKDGKPFVKTHLHDDGTGIFIVSEDLDLIGIRLLYAEPLPYLTLPLSTGERSTESKVTVVRLSDGALLDHSSVDQTLTVLRPSATPSTAEFGIRTERRMRLGSQTIHPRTTVWFRPGVGQVRSESSGNGPDTRQELLCATIAGRRVGDCDAAVARDAKP